MLEIERVTRHERLRELEPQLDDLFVRDRQATPFQSPAWLLPWAEHFAPAGGLRSLVVHAQGRALAWLPLQRSEAGGACRFAWLGGGISDRLDALLDTHAGRAPLDLAVRELCAWSREEAVGLELDELPDGSPLASVLREAGARLERGSISPWLALNTHAASELEQRLPTWLRRNLHQTEARLGRRGRPEWRRATAADIGSQLEHFMQLHTARWRARGQAGVLADASVQAFHRSVAPRLVERGLLELDVLSIDERPLAATYVLRRIDAHLYLFGFDPDESRLSLGSAAIWRSVRLAAASGARRYDFLRGCEPYKYAFGARNAESWRCALMPSAPLAASSAQAGA